MNQNSNRLALLDESIETLDRHALDAARLTVNAARGFERSASRSTIQQRQRLEVAQRHLRHIEWHAQKRCRECKKLEPLRRLVGGYCMYCGNDGDE